MTNSAHAMTRRAAMQRSAAALLGLGLWPGVLRAKERDSGNFKFLVINDTHYMSPDCGAFLDRVVHQMRYHPGVEFCLVVGDLVDKGHKEHLGIVREIFSGLGVPVYPVIGNHDHLTSRDRTGYDEVFSGRSNYLVDHRGWQFLGLDTTDGSDYDQTTIHTPTLNWVDDTVRKLDKSRPTVVFTHFPLGDRVKYRPKNADALLERFRDVNLQAVFNGHFHGFTERAFKNHPVTTNRCCALRRGNHDKTKEKGYFLCTAENGTIRREFVQVFFRPSAQPGRRVAG